MVVLFITILTSVAFGTEALIGKLNLDLGKDTTAKYSRGPSRLREEQSAKSSSNSSNIHIGSAVSPYKPKTQETLSIGRMTKESPKVMLKSEPRSSNARVSTLMKPTASHLAKLRSLKPPSKKDERSSWNSSVSYNAAPKRQKLESGYLRKVTVPRDPQLETMQRAQRRSFRSNNDSESSDHAKDRGHPSKSQPLNTKLSKSQNAESATHSTSVAFKRPNTQNAAKQGNSVTLLKSKALRCNKVPLI
ncbi:uncharacterized protein LOC132606177 [Lycium barbarum]|uniref:uncharacterized protein LOC132606177 n=1 Tax=Lycium barbarum TaxID=112863 RepID=UPI00293F74C2|nr:uncharacterized protein LOC132606177 [Lycium barbarum]